MAICPAGPPKLMNPSFTQKRSALAVSGGENGGNSDGREPAEFSPFSPPDTTSVTARETRAHPLLELAERAVLVLHVARVHAGAAPEDAAVRRHQYVGRISRHLHRVDERLAVVGHGPVEVSLLDETPRRFGAVRRDREVIELHVPAAVEIQHR